MERKFRKILQFFVSFYQISLSGIFGGNCRFYPSCSHYGAEALREWPWPKALLLISRRLGKCHPWGPQGYDPVPRSEGETQHE